MRISFSSLLPVLALSLAACGGTDATVQDQGVYGANDGAEGDNGEDGLATQDEVDPGEGNNGEGAIGDVFADGSTVEATSNLNLRSGPSTDKSVLRTMPEGSQIKVVDGTAQNGFIKVEQNGLAGYSAYRYLQAASGGSSGGSAPSTSSGRQKALDIANGGVGLSYWWGHGKLVSGAVTSSNRGKCSGSCPSCSHSGQSGADCSGFVAKVWGVPSSNTSLTADSHPYSTSDFYNGTGGGKWATISKSAMQPGDAMVYRSGSSGHVFLYEKGDAWGQPWAYEARGCSYGVVHNVRSAGSSFKGIKRVGF